MKYSQPNNKIAAQKKLGRISDNINHLNHTWYIPIYQLRTK